MTKKLKKIIGSYIYIKNSIAVSLEELEEHFCICWLVEEALLFQVLVECVLAKTWANSLQLGDHLAHLLHRLDLLAQVLGLEEIAHVCVIVSLRQPINRLEIILLALHIT